MSRFAQMLVVQYGGVSVGDHSASVAFSFDREKLTPERADALLCGKRLEVYCCVGTDPEPDQQTLDGVEDNRPIVRATADSPRLGMSPKKWAGRLQFSLEEMNASKLIGLAKRTGSVMFNVLGPIPEREAADESTKPEAPRLPIPAEPKRKRRDDWAATPIEELAKFKNEDGKPYLTKAKCEALRESELEIGTVGRLETVIRTDRTWASKVRGLGPKWIDRVTDALIAFRLAHPVPSEHEPEPVTEATREDDDEELTERREPNPDDRGHGWEAGDDGQECSIDGAESHRITDAAASEWAVTVHTAVGADDQFRSCHYIVRGNTIEGQQIPTEDSEAYPTRREAATAAAHRAATIMAAWRQTAGYEVEKWAQRVAIGSAKPEEQARPEPGGEAPGAAADAIPDVVPFEST